MRGPRLVAVCALCLTLAPAAARADNAALAKARQQIADLYFEEAIASLRAALEAGGNDPATTAEIHRLWGEVAATLGRTKDAQGQFAAYLAIDPAGKLSEGVSPKITKPFAAAKDDLGGKSIAITHEVVGNDPPKLKVQVTADPLAMITGIVVDGADAGGAAKAARAARGSGVDDIEIGLEAGTVNAIIYAVDTHGNQLAAIGSTAEPITIEAPPATEPDPETGGGGEDTGEGEDREFRSYWILTGGLTLGLATLGTVAGLSAQRHVDDIERKIIDSENIEFGTEVKPIEDKARRDALVANIAFAAAGAAAIATVVLYLTTDDPEQPPAAAIVPSVGRDNVGVAAAIRF